VRTVVYHTRYTDSPNGPGDFGAWVSIRLYPCFFWVFINLTMSFEHPPMKMGESSGYAIACISPDTYYSPLAIAASGALSALVRILLGQAVGVWSVELRNSAGWQSAALLGVLFALGMYSDETTGAWVAPFEAGRSPRPRLIHAIGAVFVVALAGASPSPAGLRSFLQPSHGASLRVIGTAHRGFASASRCPRSAPILLIRCRACTCR